MQRVTLHYYSTCNPQISVVKHASTPLSLTRHSNEMLICGLIRMFHEYVDEVAHTRGLAPHRSNKRSRQGSVPNRIPEGCSGEEITVGSGIDRSYTRI